MELTTSYQKLGEKKLGNSYGDLYIRIYAKYSEQDVANNQTKVQYQARGYYSGNSYILDQQSSGNVKGTSASQVNFSRSSSYSSGETTLGTTEAWVTHNSDGTMSISASAYLSFPNWGWSGTASGTATLPNLHKPPVINTATMVETNSVLTAISVPNTTVVQYLSKKTITLSGTAYDSATLKYRLRHFNTNYDIPSSSTFQTSATFNTDYTTHDVSIGSGKANIIQDVGDSLNGLSTDWVYVNIGGTAQKPNGIAYTKPALERATTNIKRKSGNGTNLTDNKAVLNIKAKIYKTTADVVGSNNSVTQLGYKIWATDASEPSSYTSVTASVDSSGNVTISPVTINNIIFTKVYNYKIIIKDKYNYTDTILDGKVPTGESTWTEYKDRVDFKEITIGQNKILSQLGKSIRVKMSAAQTISRTTTTKVNTDTLDYNTSTALTFSNNRVNIGEGVSAVLVNCRYTAWGANSGGRYIYVYKNGATFAFNNRSYSQTMETTVVVPVVQGDYIEMYCYNEQSDTFSISSADNQTFLQVTILG